MTIRQYIKRRLAWALGVAISAWLLLVASMVTAGKEPPVPLIAVGMLTFFGAVVFVNLAIRCPRCRGNLGITIVPAMFSFHSKRRASYCPFCGVSLDEDLSE
jgi:hypothetical protein